VRDFSHADGSAMATITLMMSTSNAFPRPRFAVNQGSEELDLGNLDTVADESLAPTEIADGQLVLEECSLRQSVLRARLTWGKWDLRSDEVDTSVRFVH